MKREEIEQALNELRDYKRPPWPTGVLIDFAIAQVNKALERSRRGIQRKEL